jgi:hypothetical protein
VMFSGSVWWCSMSIRSFLSVSLRMKALVNKLRTNVWHELLRCQYLFFSTSKASKLSTSLLISER